MHMPEARHPAVRHIPLNYKHIICDFGAALGASEGRVGEILLNGWGIIHQLMGKMRGGTPAQLFMIIWRAPGTISNSAGRVPGCSPSMSRRTR